MFRNYIITAWRSLGRNKVYSSINIIGLSIGLAVCMMIMLYVDHESSYDTFHKNANRICSVYGKVKMGSDSIFMPYMSYVTAPLVKENDPVVESFVRLDKISNPYAIVQNIENPSLKFSEKNFLFADSNFFNFFSFELLIGNKERLFQNPFSIVISENAAKKYFGKQNPIGKVLRYNNEYNFTVTGVAAKVPSNSSLDFDFVASLSSLLSTDEGKKITKSQAVQLGAFATYFLLKNRGDIQHLVASINNLHQSEAKDETNQETYYASSITDIHQNMNFGDSSNVKYLEIFPLIAALILLLALINYMSLSTARATLRAKEIGVRKVMGAGRKTIATQFFVESALYTAIAFVLGYVLCSIFQPLFFNFLQIDIDSAFLRSPNVLISFFVLFIITVFFAATYPSILLSAYKPVMVLYGKFSKQSAGLSVRKFFTVFQFTISLALIICGLVIGKQMYFFRNKDTGVNRSNIVMVPFASSIGRHYTAFKKETESLSAVSEVATAHYPMYKGHDAFFTKAKNSNENVFLPILSVDKNFIPLLGLKWKMAPDDSLFYHKENSVIINETAIEKLNLGRRPLNEKIQFGNESDQIAGVLKDFNYETLQNKIGPLAIFVANDNDTASVWGQVGGCLFAKIKPHADVASVMSQIKMLYDKYDQTTPFEFYFMDDAYDAMYRAENRLAKISDVFVAFTLLIACLGLFGLATFMASQRTKEIGIRKVLGASIASIATLLSKDFIKLIIIAIVIASPIAWWAMNKWLQGFAYRIDLSVWIFLIAGVATILIALITVSFQSIKAATSNPVKSLRTE